MDIDLLLDAAWHRQSSQILEQVRLLPTERLRRFLHVELTLRNLLTIAHHRARRSLLEDRIEDDIIIFLLTLRVQVDL